MPLTDDVKVTLPAPQVYSDKLVGVAGAEFIVATTDVLTEEQPPSLA
jgi:hypothetical protein